MGYLGVRNMALHSLKKEKTVAGRRMGSAYTVICMLESVTFLTFRRRKVFRHEGDCSGTNSCSCRLPYRESLVQTLKRLQTCLTTNTILGNNSYVVDRI